MRTRGGKRKGAGRPVTTGGGIQIAIRVSPELLKRIDELGAFWGVGRSEAVRQCVARVK